MEMASCAAQKETLQRTKIGELVRDNLGFFENKHQEHDVFKHRGVDLEDQTEAFVDKINTILDFNILRYELRCFKFIYIAGTRG